MCKARYVYSSLLSPFCEAEILECVADTLHGSGTTFWLNALQDRPRCCCSLLAHWLPLSDHWPRRHV
ncbi:hypothetical protein NQZ68_012131 [Dissostichus eleginoides]|nr:hypothetical protein NQZ68_012131 [Dissostichus eleginoides]